GPAFRGSAGRVLAGLGRVQTYGDLVAFRGIDLEVEPGEVFGFLGPNGAGKTTTISILCTLLRPTAGEARVAGIDVAHDPGAVRSRLGRRLPGSPLHAQPRRPSAPAPGARI